MHRTPSSIAQLHPSACPNEACECFGIVSRRALDVAAKTENRGYVLDLVEWAKRADGFQTPMTVPDLTLQCLVARLEEMLAEGDERFERHRDVAQMHREWAKAKGMSIMAEEGYESDTVTAIYLPDGIPGSAFVSAIKEHLNVQLSAGYGKTKDEAFRIASMGTTSVQETEHVLEGMGIIVENWKALRIKD